MVHAENTHQRRNTMRYIKPAVLSSVIASKSVMGIPKAAVMQDNSSAGDQSLNTASAYEADE